MGAALALREPVRAPAKIARGQLHDGIAVIQVGDRIVMVDTNDHNPSGHECVVLHWDGRIAIDRPVDLYTNQYASQARLHSASPVKEGPVIVRRGVIVLGRIVREY